MGSDTRGEGTEEANLLALVCDSHLIGVREATAACSTHIDPAMPWCMVPDQSTG